MNRGYVRGHFDRELTDDGLTWFTAATEGVKRDGIDLRMSGARLERYNANPVILYGHNAYGRSNLPIGRAPSMGVEGERLRSGIEWDEEDEFALSVKRKITRGFLNAVSIGFDVLKWENPSQNMWKGGVAVEWELFEISVVPVPMDERATVESGRSDDDTRQFIRDLVKSEFERLYLNEVKQAVPVIDGVDANRVLASLKLGGDN